MRNWSSLVAGPMWWNTKRCNRGRTDNLLIWWVRRFSSGGRSTPLMRRRRRLKSSLKLWRRRSNLNVSIANVWYVRGKGYSWNSNRTHIRHRSNNRLIQWTVGHWDWYRTNRQYSWTKRFITLRKWLKNTTDIVTNKTNALYWRMNRFTSGCWGW